MNPKFYANGPVVLIERDSRTLVIADPHFGVEADLKHMIPYGHLAGKNEVPSVLKQIRDRTEFRLAPGNHDS